MGFFDSKSSTVNNTQTTVENKHATAGADGFAVGAGSNVQIENVSDDIAADAFDANKQVSRDALDANRDVSGRAFDLAEETNDLLADFGRDALSSVASTTARQTSDFLSFADSFTKEQNDTVEEQLDRNNRLAMHTSELIAAQAGVVAPADGKRNQYLAFGALALVALFVITPQLRSTVKKVAKSR